MERGHGHLVQSVIFRIFADGTGIDVSVFFSSFAFLVCLGKAQLDFGRYVIMQLGLAGPLMQVTMTAGREVKRQATNKLREQFAQPILETPISSRNSTTTDTDSGENAYEMRRMSEPK